MRDLIAAADTGSSKVHRLGGGGKLLLSSFVAFMLASCLPSTDPERTELCLNSESTPGWTQQGPESYSPLLHHAQVGTQPVDYGLVVNPLFYVSGMDTSTYWVSVHASFRMPYPYHPELIQRMLYQPDDAWIEVNGVRTTAGGVVQMSPLDLNKPPRSVAWPVDLLGLTSPKDSLYDSLFIAFPVHWPKEPQDHWILHLGSLKLGNQTLTIPDRKSCFFPSHTVWVPIYLGKG